MLHQAYETYSVSVSFTTEGGIPNNVLKLLPPAGVAHQGGRSDLKKTKKQSLLPT